MSLLFGVQDNFSDLIPSAGIFGKDSSVKILCRLARESSSSADLLAARIRGLKFDRTDQSWQNLQNNLKIISKQIQRHRRYTKIRPKLHLKVKVLILKCGEICLMSGQLGSVATNGERKRAAAAAATSNQTAAELIRPHLPAKCGHLQIVSSTDSVPKEAVGN